jgi:hypothetical protein
LEWLLVLGSHCHRERVAHIREKEKLMKLLDELRSKGAGEQAVADHKSQRMTNLSTTLSMIERIDELVHGGKVPSRAHLIREAVRNYLKPLE